MTTTSSAATREPYRATRHRSLRRSINGLSVAIVGLVVIIAVVSSFALVNLIDARRTLLNEIDPASLSTDQLLLAYVDEETGVRGYILSRRPQFLQPTESGMQEQKSVTRNLNAELSNQPELLGEAQKAETEAQTWQTTWAQKAIGATAAGDGKYATPQALAHGKELLDRARADFSSLSRSLTVKRNEDGRNLNRATTILAVVVAGGVVVLVGGLLALRIGLRRWVMAPLGMVASDARRVTRGDLGHEISAPEPVEILELGQDIEAMRQRIVQEFRGVEAARRELDERNEELRRSNLELEQFAYVASHDLQEPLRKVTSFVRLLQQRYEGQLDERADQYIEFTVDGATRMQQLISDLLAFSRVGRDTDSFEVIPLRECVDTAVGNLEVLIDETGALIHVADLPTVQGDRALLTSLWQNLIGNSVKFRSEETPEVSIAVDASGTQWKFSITDNGIGIEPRFAEKVFVIFQRLHGRDAYPGTGIGLALCSKIVDFHGGRIWLDTDHPSGTRICFTLPVVGAHG